MVLIEGDLSGDFYSHLVGFQSPQVRINLPSVRDSRLLERLMEKNDFAEPLILRCEDIWKRHLICRVSGWTLQTLCLIKAGKVSMGLKYVLNFM